MPTHAASVETAKDRVEVWRVALDHPNAGIFESVGILSHAERAQAERFHHQTDRNRFLARRLARRHILGAHLGMAPREIEFATLVHGKPVLAGTTGERLQFSCSARGALALIAVTMGSPVGIDLEAHRPLGEDLAPMIRMLAPEEQSVLTRLSDADRLPAFFDCWTRKEALLKLLGLGLCMALDQFVVETKPGAPPCVLRFPDALDTLSLWSLKRIEVGPACSATLATKGDQAMTMHIWDWNSKSRQSLPSYPNKCPPLGNKIQLWGEHPMGRICS